MATESSQSSGGNGPPGGGDQTAEEFKSQILNFVDNGVPLNVVVERPVAGWKPSNPVKEDSIFLPSEGIKGLALIINIVEYKDDITNASRRYGSEHDVEYLTDLLIQLDYKLYPSKQKIRELKYKPKETIKSQIETFKTLCTQQQPESIILFIGSHGNYPNKIVTSDLQLMDIYEDVVYKFTQDPNFTALEGKPKIFLVQACQSYCSNGSSTVAHTTIHQNPQNPIQDVYICTSTTPGKASMRNIYKGSWFPYCFTYVMMKHALKMKSLQEIMKLVEKMLGQIEDYQEFKQVPSVVSGSNDKPLYFVKSDYSWTGVRNYEQNPSWLEGASKFCIICTINTQITCDKVNENLSGYSILRHEWEDFPKFLSSERCRLEDGVVDVVVNCTPKRFELILRKLGKIKRQRIIFITAVDRQAILDFNPEKYKVDVKVDPMSFEDLSLPYQLKIVERLERKYGISFSDDELNGELLVDVISGREMFHDEIKSRQLSYYVPRTVLTRNIISEELFEKRYSTDIFLVRGIQRSRLSSIVKYQMTGRSQDQLGRITVTFMTLDSDSHFDTICKNTSKSVHMLNYENEKLRWIQTRVNLKAIQGHIATEQEEQMEENFCSLICSDSGAPICISDSPGMGKTILLAQIGKRLRRMFPDRTVLFVELSSFIQRVKNELKHNDEVDKKVILKALQDTVCKTLLGRHILQSKLNLADVSIELLLDGFDEVKQADSGFAHDILKSIRSSIPSIRMWVTSRPHKLEELEVTLGGLGYNIKPFTETDQINFLERFWLQYTKKLNSERLREFASKCLKSLTRKMSSSEKDIAGIPLQCFLIGEVYAGQAQEYSKKGETCPLPEGFLISSITTLYQKVIEKKIAIYRSKFGPQSGPKDSEFNRPVIVSWLLRLGATIFSKIASPNKRQKLNDAQLNDLHTHLGMSLVFPDLLRTLKHSFDPLDTKDILNVGIWELSSGLEPKVLHRTFAEYFAALFIRDKLVSGNGWGRAMAKFITENVLQVKVGKYKVPEFTYPVVIYFLNALLTSDPNVPEVITSPSHVAKDVQNAINDLKLSQLVYAFAHANCDNILKLFDKIGLFTHPATASAIFDKDFISCAVKHSDLEVVCLGFIHFDKYHKNGFDAEMKAELLYQAVKRGQVAPVEFLINEKGLRTMVRKLHDGTRTLLHGCLTRTLKNTEAEIDQRIEILRMLDGINKELKEERDADGNTPLLAIETHVRLCIELICLGADVTAQGNFKETILHGRSGCTGDSYHALVKKIYEKGKLEELVHLKSNYNKTPLLDIMTFDPLPETLYLFKTAGADFNHTTKNGWSVLMIAVFYYRSISTLQTLIELGTDAHHRAMNGDTLLHVVADKGMQSVATLEFLVKVHGLNVNALNNLGKTPLDIVLEQTYGNRYFEMGLTIFELGGRTSSSKDSLSRWGEREIFECSGRRTMVSVVGPEGREDSEFDNNGIWRDIKPLYVSILLLHIYFFGMESVESGVTEMSTTPSPHPMNYLDVRALLIKIGAKDTHYGAMGRLNEILHNTIDRTIPIWDQDTIDKFVAGELVCHFKTF